MSRLLLLVVLSLTAADAAGAGRLSICPMRATELAGCGHCPPAPARAVRQGLPDCCALHAAERAVPFPSEEAARQTRSGPAVAVLFATVSGDRLEPSVGSTRSRRLPGAVPPQTRNLPLLR